MSDSGSLKIEDPGNGSNPKDDWKKRNLNMNLV